MTGSIIRRSLVGLSLALALVTSASVLRGWMFNDLVSQNPPSLETAGALNIREEAKHLKRVRQLTFGGQSEPVA